MYSYSKKMFTGRGKPIRIISVRINGVLLYISINDELHESRSAVSWRVFLYLSHQVQEYTWIIQCSSDITGRVPSSVWQLRFLSALTLWNSIKRKVLKRLWNAKHHWYVLELFPSSSSVNKKYNFSKATSSAPKPMFKIFLSVERFKHMRIMNVEDWHLKL
jgi:hypothetical protein